MVQKYTRDASGVDAHNWRQRASQLAATARAMGSSPASKVLLERAAEYLRRAEHGEAHIKSEEPRSKM
jgi:hypothetical protein